MYKCWLLYIPTFRVCPWKAPHLCPGPHRIRWGRPATSHGAGKGWSAWSAPNETMLDVRENLQETMVYKI